MFTTLVMKQYDRMERALSQTMFLISAHQHTEDHWKFCVEGSRGINYDVEFTSEGMICNCPDFIQRERNCKHMFFIIGRIGKLNLKLFDTDSPYFNIFKLYPELSTVLKEVLERRLNGPTTETNEEVLTSEDDCCICFESMVKGKLITCSTCKNIFHGGCINIWLSNSARDNCPLCRTRWPTLKKVSNIDVLGKLTV